jgi:hypothetical protein
VSDNDLVGVLPSGDTLATELAASHLFLCDYELLEGAQVTGEIELNGERRYLTAPFVLLHADASRGIR